MEAKLNGAKKAGAQVILIPKENKEHLERLFKNNHIKEEDNFKIILVEHINECIKYVIKMQDTSD